MKGARPLVAVVHDPRSFHALELRENTRGSCDVLWLVEARAHPASSLRLLGKLGPILDISDLDVVAAARLLASHQPDGIVTFVDHWLLWTAMVAERLGFPFHSPEVAATLVDKRLQRQVLSQAGLAQPKFFSIAKGKSSCDIEKLLGGATFPMVLKPAEGSGSRGICRVDSMGELTAVADGDVTDRAWIVEQLLPDRGDHPDWCASYLSIESVVAGGQIRHVASTGRFPLAEPFRETGNFMPALLNEEDRTAVVELVTGSIEALDPGPCVLHTEVKLTPEGPILIEVNGRLGGRPPYLLLDVGKVNLFAVAAMVSTGAVPELAALDDCDDVGFWIMAQPPVDATVLTGATGIDELQFIAGVERVERKRSDGEAVDWREGTDGRVVTVRGRVADHDRLANTYHQVQQTWRFTWA